MCGLFVMASAGVSKRGVQRAYLFRFVGLVMLLVMGALAVQVAQSQGVSSVEVRDFVQSFGVWSAIIFLLFNALCGVFLVPGLVPIAIGAVLFGWQQGSFLNVVGTMLAAMTGFVLARSLGKRFVQDVLGGRFDRFQRRIEANGWRVMFIVRLIPVLPFFGVNYIAGVSRINAKDYFEGSLIGMIPPVFLYTYLFASVGDNVLAEGITWSVLSSPHTVLPLIALALLVILPVLLRKQLAKFERGLED